MVYTDRMNVRILCFVAFVTLAVVLAGCASRPKPPRGVTPYDQRMEVTGYCKCGDCCNWKRNIIGRPKIKSGPAKGQKKKVGVTAAGTKAKIGTVAADTTRYPFGTIVYVPGYGYGRVEDRGGAIKGEKLDLFFNSHRDALKWGRQTATVRVWKP